jgi:hypothetical protein
MLSKNHFLTQVPLAQVSMRKIHDFEDKTALFSSKSCNSIVKTGQYFQIGYCIS